MIVRPLSVMPFLTIASHTYMSHAYNIQKSLIEQSVVSLHCFKHVSDVHMHENVFNFNLHFSMNLL